MANAATQWNVQVSEDSGGSIAARVRNPNAAYITQATITSISARYRRLDKSATTTTASLTVASVVFDTLQTDTFWKDIGGVLIDTIGYNFRWDFAATVFPDPGIYGVTFVFTPSSGAAYNVNVKVTVPPRLA
jgi:hypothetical protein